MCQPPKLRTSVPCFYVALRLRQLLGRAHNDSGAVKNRRGERQGGNSLVRFLPNDITTSARSKHWNTDNVLSVLQLPWLWTYSRILLPTTGLQVRFIILGVPEKCACLSEWVRAAYLNIQACVYDSTRSYWFWNARVVCTCQSCQKTDHCITCSRATENVA